MDANQCFVRAKKWDDFNSWIFIVNTVLSFGLIFTKNTKIESYVAFPLFALVFVSLFFAHWTRYWINKGNALRRISQFSDAFGVACEYPARFGYYNNSLQPGLKKLLATTCESSGFTREILEEMVRDRILKLTGFIVIFFLYIGYWKADSNIVAVAAQVIFSGGLISNLINSLIYLTKVQRANEAIMNLFRAKSNFSDLRALSIGLSAHVNYECAKEEAGILLDSKIYIRKNPDFSKRWEIMRKELEIDTL